MTSIINLFIGFILGFVVATVGVDNVLDITGENVERIQEFSNTLTN